MDRPQITVIDLDIAMKEVQLWMNKRREEKGSGSYSSTHEMRGVIDEEILELKEAMHAKDYDAITHELKDVIIGAIFGLACLKSGKLQW